MNPRTRTTEKGHDLEVTIEELIPHLAKQGLNHLDSIFGIIFRNGDGNEVFHPLPGPLLALHRRLKQRFDPAGILNPGRMYPDL